MSTLQLLWRERKISGAQTSRKFLDFVIDGDSFYDQVAQDLISPLGWGVSTYHQIAIDRFLMIAPPDFADGRSSILVCGECGDLGCGALSAIIEEVGDLIIWKAFKYQNNYDADIGLAGKDYSDLGPFSFDAYEYKRVIRQAGALPDEHLEIS